MCFFITDYHLNEVDIFTLELVLHGFIICLDTEGAHNNLWRRTNSTTSIKKKDVYLIVDWMMSSYRIMRIETHQSTFFHVSPIYHRCRS
jgi:hypothetical protein